MSNSTPGSGKFTFDDATGALLVSSSGAASGVNITEILNSPVALGNPLPVELSDGTNPFGTLANPLSVNVISGGGSNNSVGVTGDAAPTSATEIGAVNPLGVLTATQSDIMGNIKVIFGNPKDVTVLQEILQEVRAMRRLLAMVYEETGQGDPTNDLLR